MVFKKLIIKKEVRIVVFNSGGFLLIKNPPEKKTWPNLWSFPGGSVEKGETEVGAAIRELKEETGIAIGGHNIIFSHNFAIIYGPNFSRWVYVYYTHVAQKPVFNPDTKVSGCPVNYCWVNQSTNVRILTPCTQAIIENYLCGKYEKILLRS